MVFWLRLNRAVIFFMTWHRICTVNPHFEHRSKCILHATSNYNIFKLVPYEVCTNISSNYNIFKLVPYELCIGKRQSPTSMHVEGTEMLSSKNLVTVTGRDSTTVAAIDIIATFRAVISQSRSMNPNKEK